MPNTKVLTEKQALVAELKNRIAESQTGVLVDYKGINVADDTALRRKLREAGVEYTVIKNTLFNFAIQGTELESLSDVLFGTTALATSSSDVVAPAKVIKEYADASKGAFTIKAGFIEGKAATAEQINELGDIPSYEILIARLLGALNAPLTQLAVALNEISKLDEMPTAKPKAEAAPVVEEIAASAEEVAEEAPTKKTAAAKAEAADADEAPVKKAPAKKAAAPKADDATDDAPEKKAPAKKPKADAADEAAADAAPKKAPAKKAPAKKTADEAAPEQPAKDAE